MNEFKYYDIRSPFPTLAPGLFTCELETKGEKKYQIVVRGYDKFFNIWEVPRTAVPFFNLFSGHRFHFFFRWPSLKTHTAALYILFLKSNRCIIFIATLTLA